MGESFKYRAFISYSHADEAWATWLHQRLERYRVPSRLVGKSGRHGTVPRRIGRCFRDQAELSAASNLGETLQQALQDSQALIIVCSPRSAASHWVNEEIKYFRSLGKGADIYALIVDGEPGAKDPADECFPPALLRDDSRDAVHEPLAADARSGKDGKIDGFLKLAAGLIGVGFDELRRREQRRRARLMIGAVAASLSVTAITAALAISAYRARNEAEAVNTFFSDEILRIDDPNRGSGGDPTYRSIIERAAQAVDRRLADQPMAAARVHEALADAFGWLRDYPSSLREAQRSLTLVEQLDGKDSAEAFVHRVLLADILSRSTRFADAAELYRECLAYADRHLGDTDPRTAELLASLARDYDVQGLIKESMDIVSRLLVAASKIADASEQKGEWYFIAGLYLSRVGEITQAERALQKAIDIRSAANGPDHYGVAWAHLRHGLALADLGRYPEADAEVRLASDQMAKWRGPDFPQAIQIHANVGQVLFDGGRRAEGVKIIEDDLQRCENRCPDFEAGTLGSQLGAAYVVIGRPAEATGLLREALRHLEASPGSGLNVEWAELHLAEALLLTGRKTEADRLLRSAEGALPHLTAAHPFLAALRRVQGLSLMQDEQFEKARADFSEAADILNQRYGPDHWRTQQARQELERARAART